MMSSEHLQLTLQLPLQHFLLQLCSYHLGSETITFSLLRESIVLILPRPNS
jgi:hypothetical protein